MKQEKEITKVTPLDKEIERLAREKGYPRRRLSHSEYVSVLQQAHDNVFKQKTNHNKYDDLKGENDQLRGHHEKLNNFADQLKAENERLLSINKELVEALTETHNSLLSLYKNYFPDLSEDCLKDLRTYMKNTLEVIKKHSQS